MEISITQEAYDSLLSQALKESPKEACGYLLGLDNSLVVENFPMTNIDKSEEHFSFDPKEQFAALNHARKKNFRIIGNWHSHPNTPSRPSQEDIRLAYDKNILYFILSLKDGQYDFNAFKIIESVVEKIKVQIIK